MIKVVFFCLLSFNFLFAAPSQEKFLESCALYDDCKFDTCENLLNKIEPENFSLLFNLGSCKFQRGAFAEAILDWRKAQKYSDSSEYKVLEHCISQAKEKLGLIQHSDWKHQLKVWLLAQLNNLPILYLFLLLLILWWFTCISMIRLWRAKKYLFLIILFLVDILLLMAVLVKITEHSCLVVLKDCKVRVGPTLEFHPVNDLKPGQELTVLDKKDNWYRVKAPEIQGWLSDEAVSLV